jgi:hydroxymethylbilane synthase
MKKTLSIATRTSPLAMRQAEIVKALLLEQHPNIKVDFLEITTAGDIDQTTPLSAFGNTGVFVKGLEQKLLSGEADLAVHSLKDVPADQDTQFRLVAFPQREDVRDVLVTADNTPLAQLKKGAIVGTSSPARQEQLKVLRPDLVFKNIRGNVGTRIQKVKDGQYDATILAAAGLKRLGHTISPNSYFTLDELVPSPGQGALAIQVHKDNHEVIALLNKINQATIQAQVEAERRFMQVIGGGCRYPVAAHAEILNDKVILRAIAHKPQFTELKKIKVETTLKELYAVAEQTANDMLSN